MEEEFYISLPKQNKDQSVAALIRHALAAIKLGNIAQKDIAVEHFYLVSPYVEDDGLSIYAKYAPIDQEGIERRESNLKLRGKHVDTEPVEPIVFAENHHTGMVINSFVQRLPLHDEQGNAIKLLREAANTLERLGDIQVKDLILHDFLDEDGLEHPYVSVHYSS